MKWWLISDDDVLKILELIREIEQCASHSEAASLGAEAIHTLESGLHKTDEEPEDFSDRSDNAN